jgi:mannose-6-phosphate isomerase-like protein (cupin superfamily)
MPRTNSLASLIGLIITMLNLNCQNPGQTMNKTIKIYQTFLANHDWQDLVQGRTPEICGCGKVYNLSNLLNRPNEDLAIADMRDLHHSEPHYHPAHNFEIYLILQGSGLVIVGDQEYQAKTGDAIVIPPLKAHYVIPDHQLVIAVVNTPPFAIENYIPLIASNPTVEFDYERFKYLSAQDKLFRTEFSLILKPSSNGIGVFALENIPAGALLFNCSHNMRKLKISDVPEALRQYCIYLNADELIAPERFDRLEIGWFLNHSESPNLSYNGTQNFGAKQAKIYAARNIKTGEELLMDYNELNEPEHLKEDYYKK